MKRILMSIAVTALLAGALSAARADETSVPTKSATPTAGQAKTTTPMESGTKSSTHPSNKKTLDLNVATKEELMKLPGMKEPTAEKIIAARPFKSVSELETRSLVTKEEYGKIHSHLKVKKAS